MAIVFEVIFDLISSISGVELSKSTANSTGIPPCSLTYEAYGG